MRTHKKKDMQITGLLSCTKMVLERKYSRKIPQRLLVYLNQIKAGQAVNVSDYQEKDM